MVQKKVPILQTDHVKFSKLLKNLKPSSFQHQESMNRGTDMKIMKKQRQNLCSPSFRKQISQPGKPPPSMSATSSSSPSKMQSLINMSEKKPNYMKPTTSSDARKETCQVNFKYLETYKKNGKSPSKLLSALTRTTSFKPTRTASKKSYPFVENENLNVLKPTCSSVLKDSKFPDFLTLNSGGTESEGSSIMKVCSYTYCSLNGHHHHPPLPPLKSFLSARRHILKTQRNIKMGSLSTLRWRENRDVIEENETLQEDFLNEDDEFFIQIYSKESEDTDSVDYSLEDNNNVSVVGEFSDPVIITMESLENQGDEVESTGINMEDIQAFSPLESDIETEGHATLYLDDPKPVEIEKKYFEDLNLEEMIEESIDEETITGTDADSDHDFEIEETTENSIMQSDDENDESGIYTYDKIDNTNFMKFEVDNEDVVEEDDNQELKKDRAVDDHYQPCDHKSETEDDNQELKKDGTIGDYYQPSDQKSESENDNQQLQKQSSIADHYQPTDQKSENDDENQELKKDCAIDDHYQLSDQKSLSEHDNQELEKNCSIDDQYQPSDQKSESESIENLEKTDDSIALCTGSQSDLTKKFCHASKNTHTIHIDEDASKHSKIRKWIYNEKESISEENDLEGFNPREPNFLEVEPGPESEKVDLKHQMIDDRRNSEEWMLDYALQQAVNKLAVARKKKVTLLVEAFETVSPLPKWEKTRKGVGFDLQHRVQACG